MFKAQDGINTEAIVIWRQKLKNYSRVTLMTQKEGLITCPIPNRRLMNLKSAGYLQPFNAVQVTLRPSGEGAFSLEQVDGIYAIQGMTDDLDRITYAAIAGELIMATLGKYEADWHLYRLVGAFSKTIRHKSIRLATIILGWQLLMLSGFLPSAKALREDAGGQELFWEDMADAVGKPISLGLRQIIIQVLSYSWQKGESLNFSKLDWKALEELLYTYASLKLERDLKSVTFLHMSV